MVSPKVLLHKFCIQNIVVVQLNLSPIAVLILDVSHELSQAFYTWVLDTFFRLYPCTKAAVIPHHHVFATAQYYYHSCTI